MGKHSGGYVPWYPQSPSDAYFPYKWWLLTKPEEIRQVFEYHKNVGTVAFDVETTSLSHEVGEIVCYSFAFDIKNAFSVPMRHIVGENMPMEDAIYGINEICKRKVLIYNAKFDLRFVRTVGIDDTKVDYFDVMSLAWNMDSNIKSPRLKDVLSRALGWPVQKYSDLLGDNPDLSVMRPEDCLEYVCVDSLGLMHLLYKWSPFLRDARNKFIVELDSQTVRPVMLFEDTPHPMDLDKVNEVQKDVETRLSELHAQIMEMVGYEFNIGSSVQVGKVLVQRFGLKTFRQTETGRMQVNELALSEIAEYHPIVPLIIEWKKVEKMSNSYSGKLGKSYMPEFGGTRFSYFVFHTPTGRLAAGGDKKNPYFAKFNIQSTTKGSPMMYRAEKTEWDDPEGIVGWKFTPDKEGLYEGFDPKFNIRQAFTSKKGQYFVHIDYAAQELRIPANLSRDPVMVKAFLSGDDYHKRIAVDMWGKENYNKSNRRLAKFINFGALYGGTAYALRDSTGISLEAGERALMRWWGVHKVLASWVKQVQREAKRKGYIRTYFGRIRRLGFWYKNSSPGIQSFADRSAVNTRVQGTAGDMMRMAILQLADYLSTQNADLIRILSSLHDELNLSIYKGDKSYFLNQLVKVLDCVTISPKEWEVPMLCDFAIGTSWGHQFSFHFDEKGELVPSE